MRPQPKNNKAPNWKRLDSPDVRAATSLTLGRIKKAQEMVQDVHKQEREVVGLCRSCYYEGFLFLNSSPLQGIPLAQDQPDSSPVAVAFCRICGKEMSTPTTRTNSLCLSCAKDWNLCVHCTSSLSEDSIPEPSEELISGSGANSTYYGKLTPEIVEVLSNQALLDDSYRVPPKVEELPGYPLEVFLTEEEKVTLSKTDLSQHEKDCLEQDKSIREHTFLLLGSQVKPATSRFLFTLLWQVHLRRFTWNKPPTSFSFVSNHLKVLEELGLLIKYVEPETGDTVYLSSTKWAWSILRYQGELPVGGWRILEYLEGRPEVDGCKPNPSMEELCKVVGLSLNNPSLAPFGKYLVNKMEAEDYFTVNRDSNPREVHE